jgi:EAL domain-containing protein (putative c-di-GMP-specific phosphodiesterase class I)/FixJ family two-component response regulator
MRSFIATPAHALRKEKTMANRRILILDDDAAVGQTIQWLAESLGFAAEFATKPEEFFERFTSTTPDIIITDLVMPDIDGVAIMLLLAARKCRAEIVIASGTDARVLDAAQRSAKEHDLRILGVVSKPISREALRSLIGEGNASQPPAAVEEQTAIREKLEITASDIQHALDRAEFEVAYQPKINCKSGALEGFEALARWNRPHLGVVMPDDFIPVAEQSELIDYLTSQIFDRSLAWFSKHFSQSNLKLSLNLSAKCLVDILLTDKLSALCRQYSITQDRIVLELTESSAMVDPTLTLDLMTRFRLQGFRLSIDDFGTGFSSMVKLVRLPFSEIKIDKSFVIQAERSEESRSVIRSVIELGHSLGLQVTAEGVETSEALDYIKRQGCDLAQGYFFARPMRGDAALAWANQRA